MKIGTLRSATAADHERVEGSLPLMEEGLTVERYRSTLERLHGMVAGWESLLERCASPEVRALAETRTRRSLLEGDLEFLNGHVGQEWDGGGCAAWDTSQLFGAMYVMEGSRLGGQLIARHVERQLHFAPGYGNAYFCGFGSDTAAMWKDFVVALEAANPEERAPAVIAGAKAMFANFETWMRDDVEVPSGTARSEMEGDLRE